MQIKSTLRRRCFELLEPGASAKLSDKGVDLFLMILIALNVLAVCLESVSSISQNYAAQFQAFEFVSVIVFTVEYILRVWTAIEIPKRAEKGPFWGRIRFMLSPLVITDFVVILPFYLGLLGIGLDLRFLRVVRLRRGFRLTRYAGGLGLLNDVIKQERRILGGVAFAILLLVIAASSALYIAESNAQPEVFSSIPATMWWAVNTLTTVGQAGAVPITTAGKIFGGIMSILGLVLLGLTAGVMASGFSAASRRRRLKYQRELVKKVDEGNEIDEAVSSLSGLAKELGLRPDVIQEMILDMAFRQKAVHQNCPHCGKPI